MVRLGGFSRSPFFLFPFLFFPFFLFPFILLKHAFSPPAMAVHREMPLNTFKRFRSAVVENEVEGHVLL
ncbi:MAG: hypothetical protein RMJ15_00300 [Nitrososphaerota archaeon]|nr:hypothetical protein [Candidatus Bathyarchaeota archaeon]MDW8022177.1 hypothetical protein [Nitrososphaerota archaeon]